MVRLRRLPPLDIPEVPRDGGQPFQIGRGEETQGGAEEASHSSLRITRVTPRRNEERAGEPSARPGASTRIRLWRGVRKRRSPMRLRSPSRFLSKPAARSPSRSRFSPRKRKRKPRLLHRLKERFVLNPLPPDESDRVFVDVTAYNSKNYFVEGDVGSPGRLPFTGLETVLGCPPLRGWTHSVSRAEGHPPGTSRSGRQAGEGLQSRPRGDSRQGRPHGQLPDLPRRPPGRGAERCGQEDHRARSSGRSRCRLS